MASLKTNFNQSMKNNYLNLEYKTVYNGLRNIFRNSNNPEQDLKEYIYSLMENIVRQNIAFKNRIATPKELAKRRVSCPPAITACTKTMNFLQKMCVEINPEFQSVEYFGFKEEDFTTIIHTEVNKTILYDSVEEYIKKEPYDLLLNDIDELTKSIPDNATYNELSEKNKMFLKDVYMKKEMAKQQMDTRSGFWKFFCRRAVKNYNEFVSKTEALLSRCNFGIEAIQDAVNYYASVNDQNDDKGHVKEHFSLKKSREELAKKSKGGVYNNNTINVIRFDEVKKQEAETHELRDKMTEIISKYPGMEPDCPSADSLRGKCMLYDNTGDKTGIKDIAKQIYWNFYKQMIKRKGVENLKEIMFDANKLTLLVMNKYTPIYEDPNLADILPELSFGTMTGKSIEIATKQALPGVEINVKEEAQSIIDEYKSLDNVALDKQTIGITKSQLIIDEKELNLESNNIVEEENIVKEVSNVNVK